eukprot:PITA_19903
MDLMSKCVVTEPSSFEEAVEDLAWVDTMVEEYDSIVRNSAWEIVPRPEGKSVVGSKWINKVKQAADGSVEKYKARFVARGFSQIKGIDYEETFAPVARYSSIWTILALSTQMAQESVVWVEASTTCLVHMDRQLFHQTWILQERGDPNLYQIVVEGKLLIIVLYVDDLILTGDELLILSCKDDLAKEFDMKDLGLLHYFLGLEIRQHSDGLFVS